MRCSWKSSPTSAWARRSSISRAQALGCARFAGLLALLLATAGCAAAPRGDYAPALDAWPLLRVWSEPERGERHVEALWPFFEWHDTPSQNAFYFRPLYNRRHDKGAGVVESDWVWPIGSGTGRRDLNRQVFYPLFLHDRERFSDGATQEQWILLPFFYFRWGRGQTDWLVFPFGGSLHNWLDRRRVTMVLWPLYVYQEREDDSRSWSVLHPIFARVKWPDGGGFKMWPLFGWASRPDKLHRLFLLWPLFTREWMKTEQGEFRRLFLFPFYGRIDDPRGRSRTILWPFFGHVCDDNTGQEDWWFPWPFLGRRTAPNVEGRTFWPLAQWERRGDRAYAEFLWPLGWYRRTTRPGEEERSLRVVPLFFAEREGDPQRSGAWQAWPLMKWRAEADGAGHFETPSVFPFRWHAELERNYGPFFRLFQYDRSPDGVRSWRFLWRLVRVDKGPADRYLEVAPLFTWRRSDGAEPVREWSLLKGLFGVSRQGARRRWQAAYLLRFTTGTASDPAARAEAP